MNKKPSKIRTVSQLSSAVSLSSTKQDALDDLVHDVFSARASDVNNLGSEEQIRFLLKYGWTVAGLETALE